MAGRLIATILENLEPAGAAADQVDGHAFPGISIPDRIAELFGTGDALVIHFGDHIAGFDFASRGRAVCFDFGDNDAVGCFRRSVSFGQLAGQRLDRHAQVGRLAFARLPAGGDDGQAFLRPFFGFDFDFQVLDPVGAFRTGHRKSHHAADFLVAKFIFQFLRSRDRFPIDGGDDVGRFEIGSGCGTVTQNPADDHSLLAATDRVFEFSVIGQVTNAHAEPRARDFTLGDQLIGNFLCQAAGDGETDARAQAANQRVDADHLAVNVHQGTAAVTGIDARVRLDEILVHRRALLAEDNVAALGADMTERHAVIQLERGADRNGKFADPRFRGIRQAGDGQAFPIDLNHRQVRLRVLAAHLGVVFLPVLEPHFDFVRVFDDVPVREDVAVFANNNARGFGIENGLATVVGGALAAFLVAPAEFTRQEVEERIVVIVRAVVIGPVGDADDHHRW